MKLLYTATSCDLLPEIGQVLLPGVPSGTIKIKKGDSIHLKLPDGRWLKTQAEKEKIICLSESAARHSKVSPGFYTVVVVPDDFLPVGLENGAEVYLAEPQLTISIDFNTADQLVKGSSGNVTSPAAIAAIIENAKKAGVNVVVTDHPVFPAVLEFENGKFEIKPA